MTIKQQRKEVKLNYRITLMAAGFYVLSQIVFALLYGLDREETNAEKIIEFVVSLILLYSIVVQVSAWINIIDLLTEKVDSIEDELEGTLGVIDEEEQERIDGWAKLKDQLDANENEEL